VKKTLTQYGLYVLLIPIFFVLHGYNQNFGLIGFTDCLLLLTTYCAAVSVLYLLTKLFFKNAQKAALLTGLLISFYLFFGALFDFFKYMLLFYQGIA
jgi:Kef-type K+ transport system membrane component KefB